MKKIIIFSCLILGISVLAYPQSDITGKVIDDFGLPLTGANVYIEGTYQGTVTDNTGRFTIRNIKNDLYILKVSFMGYNTDSRIINLTSDTEVNFTLSKANILAEEVIVSATRVRDISPVALTNVTNEEIREKNFGQDIPYILGLTPSMVTSSDAGTGIGYTNFRIRGTDLNRINITVNGIPLNDAESHGVWWVDLPDFASSVDNVQILRGVGTSVNGPAGFGATMNFQTFTMSPRSYAEINSAYGSFNTLKNNISLSSGLLNGKFTFDMRLSGITSDGFIDRAFSDLKSYHVQGAYYSKKSLVKMNVFSGEEKTYQAWWGIPSELLSSDRTYNPAGMMIGAGGDTSFYDNQTDNYQQDHYQLHFSYEFNDNLIFNSALHYTYGRGYYEEYVDPQTDLYMYDTFGDYGMDNVITGNDTLLMSDLIRQKWLDNDFYGFTWAFTCRKGKANVYLGGGMNKYNGRHFGRVVWARYAGGSEINHEWYRGTGIKTDIHIYGKLDYQLTRYLLVYGDLQYRFINHHIAGIHDNLRDVTQKHDYYFFNPKFGLRYNFYNNNSLFFAFAIANREPNRSNFIDADPAHPVPRHETLMDYELGYKAGLNKLLLEANLYYMDYKNQLVLTGEINNVGAPIMTNIPGSYRTGIELITGLKLLSNLQWDMNLTLSRNKIKGFTEYVDNWDYQSDPVNESPQISKDLGVTDLAFSPAVIAGSRISYESIYNIKIILQSKYVGKQYIDNTSSEERLLENYFVSDFIVRYNLKIKFVENIELSFQVNNLFNADYETNAWIYRYYTGGEEYNTDGYFPQAGIHVLGGIILKF